MCLFHAASTSIECRFLISCRLSAVKQRSSMKIILPITPSLVMYGSRITWWACCAKHIIIHTQMQTYAKLYIDTYTQRYIFTCPKQFCLFGVCIMHPYMHAHTHTHRQMAPMTQHDSTIANCESDLRRWRGNTLTTHALAVWKKFRQMSVCILQELCDAEFYTNVSGT